ncbi:hypothetical protein WJX84_000985 [Apatococcus fuscideae]|uniref:FAD-binding domain-containing protein n=1 Tax=Apatococcus fuscideae TaxID=2026836 RepID=A0AAW1RJA1_9CHLO
MVGTALAAALGSNPLTASMKIVLLDRQSPADLEQGLSPVPESRNSALIRALSRRLPSSLTSLQPASVQSIHLPGYSNKDQQGGSQLATISLEDGRHLRTRLLVAADGARSRMRSLAQLRTVQWMYNQRGLVATVRTAEPHATAWQRFLPTGPLALLPVRHGFSNIVWSTSPAQAAELEASSPMGFVAAVNQALQEPSDQTPSGLASLQGLLQRGQQMPQPPLVSELAGGSPKSFPLALCHAGRYVRPRFAMIGDAAHAIHPLAGQGVNLGFADVSCLAQALAEACEAGTDIGSLSFLEEHYERPRQRANVSMMAGLDLLKRLFTPQEGLLANMRNLGLDTVNIMPAVKQQIMKYAMG